MDEVRDLVDIIRRKAVLNLFWRNTNKILSAEKKIKMKLKRK